MKELKGFGRPFCVQMNKERELFVGDFATGAITIYGPNLDRQVSISGFHGPHSVSINDAGVIFINEYYGRKVSILGEDLSLRVVLNGSAHNFFPWLLTGPAQTICDREGNLVVCDYGSSSLQKFDGKTFEFLGWLGMNAEGEFSKWSKKGSPKVTSEPMGFDRVHSVTFDDQNNMYVADSGNNRLQVFDPQGNFLEILPAEVQGPASIDFSENRLVVSEYVTSQVSCFDLKGRLFWVKKGVFNHPYDVKLKEKTLIVADSDNQRVVLEDVSNLFAGVAGSA